MTTLYLISGKSGAGKTTVSETLEKQLGFRSVESYTTRPPRFPGERGHIFVTKEMFDQLPVVAYTRFDGHEYGVTADLLDRCQLYVIDPAGIKELKEKYHGRKTKAIFLDIPETVQQKRMSERGDPESKIQQRIINDRKMFPEDSKALYDVIIDATPDIETVVRNVLRFILNNVS